MIKNKATTSHSYNISKRSRQTIRYFAKTLANTADGLIFYFLGGVLIGPHGWNTGEQ